MFGREPIDALLDDRFRCFLRLVPHGEPAKRIRSVQTAVMDGRARKFARARVELAPVLPQHSSPAAHFVRSIHTRGRIIRTALMARRGESGGNSPEG
jgi:hypothetical protein